MITYSTPNSITCEVSPGKVLKFFGEWTLEPKFYLDVPEVAYWAGTQSNSKLTTEELDFAINTLLNDARIKGWTIEISKP